MNTVKHPSGSAERSQQRCPACYGAFTVGAGMHRKRVQCPHCREVVTLSEARAAPANVEPNCTSDCPPRMHSPTPHCELLKARIEALEHQVEALRASPPATASLDPDLTVASHDNASRSRNGAPHETQLRLRPVPSFSEPNRPAPGMRPFPTPTISILIPVGDGSARRVGDKLSEILVRASWEVRGIAEDVLATHGRSGLTLATSSSLPLTRVTATLSALRQGGFDVDLQLDPNRRTSDVALIVGAQAENGVSDESESTPFDTRVG